MNWRNVLHLIQVDMKSGRLLRGQRLIKYNVARNKFFNYLFYAISIAAGLGAGYLAQFIYSSALTADPNLEPLFSSGYSSVLFALPTIILVVLLVFTMLQQIQRSGIKFSRQAPYWLPITWKEHTLASILAELLGFPLISIAFVSSAVIMFAVFIGQLPAALGAVIMMIISGLLASSTTEIFRILLVRFTGAVYKSTGRAAIWVRFIGSLLFFIVFYVIYFSITQGANSIAFIQTIASGQSAAWFVPFVWPGLTLYYLATGVILQGIIFLVLSIFLIIGLFYGAANLNSRYGLYEPPAIKVSRSVYAPKSGFLSRLGFSSVESALIRKDLKAFTRRRELMTTFIIPIVFLLIPIMSSLNTTQPSEPIALQSFWYAFTTIFPVALMAMSLGNFLTGEEGQNIRLIYASPISPKSYVKSKYTFMMLFALAILPITSIIGFIIYTPSTTSLIALTFESIFVALAAGSLSLANGIRGADFSEAPRPRMIRTEWSFINMIATTAVGFAVLLPLLPYVLSIFVGIQIGIFLDIYISILLSGIISIVLTIIFYRVAIGNAQELISNAEV